MSGHAAALTSELFEPVTNDPLAERVAAQVEELILCGVLKEGAHLPGERDLATKLEVSRPKLREALALLESRKLVRVVAGQGAFIAPLSGPMMSPALIDLYTRHPAAVDDHLEFRRYQESFAAQLAAERATAEDKDRLATLVAAMQEAPEGGDLERAASLDSEFHMAIVEASYNRTLIHTMTALYALNRRSVFFNRTELLTSAKARTSVLRQHRDIAAAILARDPTGAAQRSMEHIDFIRTAMMQSLAGRDRQSLSHKRQVARKLAVWDGPSTSHQD